MYEVAQHCLKHITVANTINPIYFCLKVFDIEFASPWTVINILNCLQDSIDWQY